MDNSTTMRVVTAVAEATGRGATDLPPLADAVDPDALEALVAGEEGRDRRDVEVRFSYAGRDVRVATDGEVSVGPAGHDTQTGHGRTD